MVKSPASIHDRVRRQQIRYFRRELERTGRRIFNCISSGGKPPKSWIVLGFAIAVTAVFGTYQCAETQRTALGSTGSVAPIRTMPW